MKNRIKLHLNRFQIRIIESLCRQVTERAPIDEYEIESLVIGEFYKSNLQKLTFFPNDKKFVILNLSLAQAFAFNILFGCASVRYNNFIRPILEPKLPVCKSLESLF